MAWLDFVTLGFPLCLIYWLHLLPEGLVPISSFMLLPAGSDSRVVHSIVEAGPLGIDGVICRWFLNEDSFVLVDELLGFLWVAGTAGVKIMVIYI